MKHNRLLLFLSLLIFTSCYHKELFYSFDPSYGGITSGTSYYYLAHVREYKMPKGISTFPDGGMSKDVRQLFGLFKTDSITKSTILLSRLGDVVGWPSRYSTRLDKNSFCIAIGIENITFRDSVNGIYLYDFKSGKLDKYSKEAGLPALFDNSSLMTYCIENKLVVDDIASKTILYSYLLNVAPAFVTWKNDHEILIYFFNPTEVKILNTTTGKVIKSDLKYMKNFDQEIDIGQIKKIVKELTNLSRDILDQYH